jgi:hypothetical protein
MPAKITVESRQARGELGYFLSHVYLVYTDDNGREFVISGYAEPGHETADSPPFYIQDGFPISESWDKRGDNETPADRGSVELDLGGRDPASVWESMLAHARNIDAADVRYELSFYEVAFGTMAVCTSLVASILHSIGLDFDDYTPDRLGLDVVAGEENILDSFDWSHLPVFVPDETGSGSFVADQLNGDESDDNLFGTAFVLGRLEPCRNLGRG